MATRQSGVDLILKNYQNFINGLRTSQQAADRLDQSMERLRKRVDQYADAGFKAFRTMQNAGRNLELQQLKLADAMKYVNWAAANAAAIRLTGDMDKLAKAQEILIDAMENYNVVLKRTQNAENVLANARTNALNASMKATEAEREYFEATEETETSILGLLQGTESLAAVAPELAAVIAALGIAFAAAQKGVELFKRAIDFAVDVVKKAIDIMKGFVNTVIDIARGLITFIDRITRPLRDFVGNVLQIFSGIALYDFARNIGRAIQNLTEEVFDAVTAFQALEIRLDAIIARDYARQFGVSMTEAFQATTGAAQELFYWMRDLAVTTPATVEQIANVFTLSTAMGISVDMTKSLVGALTDFSAAMGLSDVVMWRIIYNLGQMITRGRISGEEFRDLSRSFFPINEIMDRMAESAGMTTEAFKELALEGGVPVLEFVQEFIDLVGEDFPDAAQRMSRTWNVVISNIKDFIQTFIGVDVFKPVLDRMSGMIADFLDQILKDPVLQNSTRLIGQALLAGFETLVPAVNDLVSAVGELISAFSGLSGTSEILVKSADGVEQSSQKIYNWARTMAVNILAVADLIAGFLRNVAERISSWIKTTSFDFGDFLSKAAEWGINFIKAFADGIARGIEILTTVINTIAGILEAWFGPGSPPAIAPNIDQWGAEAMAEFLKGFTLVDFSLFNDITGLMESFIRSLTFDLGEESVLEQILGSRSEIAETIAQFRAGALTVLDAARNIAQSIGGMAQFEFQQYIIALLKIDQLTNQLAASEDRLAAASKRVEAAQEVVNEISSRYDAILSSLRSQLEAVTSGYQDEVRLREIAEAMSTQLLTAEEQERLEMERRAIEIERQIRSVEEQRDLELAAAREQLEIAQQAEAAARAEVEAIRDRIDVLKEQAAAFRDQIEIYIEQNKLLQEQLKLLEDVTEEEEEAFGPGSPLDIGKDIVADMNNLLDEAKAKADGWRDSLSNMWNLLEESGLFDSINNIKDAITNLGDAAGKIVNEQTLEKLGNAWDGFRKMLGIPEEMTFIEWVSDKIIAFADSVGEFFKLTYPSLAELGGAIKDFGISIYQGFYWIGESIAIILGVHDPAKEKEASSFLGFIAGVTIMLAKLGTGTLKVVSAFFLTVGYLFRTAATMVDIGKEVFGSVLEFLQAVPTFIVDLIKSVKDADSFADGMNKIGDSIKNFAEVTVKGIFEGMATRVKESIDGLIGEAQRMKDILVGNSIIPDMLLAIKNEVTGKLTETYDFWKEKLGLMIAYVIVLRDKSVEMVDSTLSKFDELQATLPEINKTFDEIMKSVDELKTSVDNLNTSFQELTNLIGSISGDVGASIGVTGLQGGGYAQAGQAYVVGERNPELFIPDVSGFVLPNVPARMSALPVGLPTPSTINNIDRSTSIQVNPTYEEIESPANIYYDVIAALTAVRR